MNHEDERLAMWLKKSLPSAEETKLVRQQVFDRLLSSEQDTQTLSPFEESSGGGSRRRRVLVAIAGAAFVSLSFAIAFHSARVATPKQILGMIERSGTPVANGEAVKANKSEGAILALVDGSRVEMRTDSELRLGRAHDGIDIDLVRGSIIVSAAKQGAGHLYVRTKDATVSVIGTVFFVSAEEVGSRVGVIQGEVNVQQGNASKELAPGQQVTTVSTMPEVPMISAISWSQSASVHLALLEQIPGVSARPDPSVGGRPNFEVASIKPDNFGDLRTTSARPLPASGTYTATNQSVRQLIRQAYGLKLFQLEGGPKWIDDLSDEKFDIDAKAAGPVTADELMLMLQGLLEGRFKLAYHRETRQLPTYALVVARKGVPAPNLHEPDPEIRQLYPVLGGPNRLTAANATMEDLASSLSRFTGGRLVQNRTGLTGRFAFTLEFSSDSVTLPRPPGLPPLPPSDGPSLFQALQEQLGLKLESDKGPVEIMIIDYVEKPSEN